MRRSLTVVMVPTVIDKMDMLMRMIRHGIHRQRWPRQGQRQGGHQRQAK